METITAQNVLDENGYLTDTTSIAVTAAVIQAENNFLSESSSQAVTAALVLAENNFVADSSSLNVTGQNVLDENGYTSANCDLTILEYLMDNVINDINLQTNSAIAAMSGSDESKTAAVTRTQAVALKAGATMMLRAYLDKGPNVGIGGLSVTAITSDPQYAVHSEKYRAALRRLQTFSAINVENIIDSAIAYVAAQTNLSMSLLSGTAGSKTVNLTNTQAAVVKLLAGLMLRVYLSRGVADAASAVTDPENVAIAQLINAGINRMQTFSATNIEYLVDTAIGYLNAVSMSGAALMSGSAGSKTVTLTGAQAAIVKMHTGQMLRVQLSRGTGIAASDPETSAITEAVKIACEKLRILSKASVELIIDKTINYVNLRTRLSISNMSGSVGSKTVTVTSTQSPVIKMVAGEFLKAAVEKRNVDSTIVELAVAGLSSLGSRLILRA
jgi:hypothetical protein